MKVPISCLFLLSSIAATVLFAPRSFAASARLELAPGEPPKLESAQAQVQYALKLKNALRGANDAARAALQADAVAAYRAVRKHWPAELELCAESAFRAGEILRAAGDVSGAHSEFSFVRGMESDTSFRARAGIEIGHLHRRVRRVEPALDLYLAVANDPKSEPEQRDEALYWAGRAYSELGKLDEARRAFETVAGRAEDPLQRIEAWDELALALVDAGDLEGAAGWIARARTTLADAALEETAQGERVRGALERMRAIRRLERAVAARHKVGTSEVGR